MQSINNNQSYLSRYSSKIMMSSDGSFNFNLPSEVLSLVLINLLDAQQLCSARLVSRQWKSVIDSILRRKKVVVLSEPNSISQFTRAKNHQNSKEYLILGLQEPERCQRLKLFLNFLKDRNQIEVVAFHQILITGSIIELVDAINESFSMLKEAEFHNLEFSCDMGTFLSRFKPLDLVLLSDFNPEIDRIVYEEKQTIKAKSLDLNGNWDSVDYFCRTASLLLDVDPQYLEDLTFRFLFDVHTYRWNVLKFSNLKSFKFYVDNDQTLNDYIYEWPLKIFNDSLENLINLNISYMDCQKGFCFSRDRPGHHYKASIRGFNDSEKSLFVAISQLNDCDEPDKDCQISWWLFIVLKFLRLIKNDQGFHVAQSAYRETYFLS